ncbi:MAG: flagellar assembly protein FliH [Helicobacteraceae bacterium]|nr:flagellar assembly protein FliH [Candidatus Sulfurimonas ponti]MBL6973626.1 flagellar assembly protein FliH [Sulfurimonas sp.]
MATLITTGNLPKHTVSKYNFKSLGPTDNEPAFSSLVKMQNESTPHSDDEPAEAATPKEIYTPEDNPSRRSNDSEIDSSSMSKASQNALIESLMKKTDEMSSNFIKLQMKLEDKEKEYEAALQTTKTTAYNEGLAAGAQQAIEDTQSDLKEGIAQLGKSIKTLENSAKEFESALELIKNDLMSAAIDIAQEVISTEIAENSSKIAKVLSDALIKDLQSAAKITLKVNPKDHGALSEHVGALEHIQVISDSAVNEGGVIAISDSGNIDSQISKRFERVKRAALSE